MYAVSAALALNDDVGRIEHCHIAATLHPAAEADSGCVGLWLFLPEAWASDGARRAKVATHRVERHQQRRLEQRSAAASRAKTAARPRRKNCGILVF